MPSTTEATSAVESSSASRFHYVDGLRGLAALAVVFYHFYGAIDRNANDWISGPLEWVLKRGYLGVDVFFVISGFVIAYSIRHGEHTGSYLVRFWARRSIRLDPPYWAAIALEITLVIIGLRFLPSLATPVPTAGDVVAHVFYVQNILGFKEILPIFWTLCYEVQFYLFVVLLAVGWRRLKTLVAPTTAGFIRASVLGSLFVASLVTRFTDLSLPWRGIALDRWFQFFLGALVWWVVAGAVRARTAMVAWVMVVAVVLFAAAPIPEQMVAVATSVSLLVAARFNYLSLWLRQPPIQYLGKISYSLYLFHLPIGWRFIALCEHLRGRDLTPVEAWLLLFAGVVVSVTAAGVLYRLLEAPSLRLCKRIKLPTSPHQAQRWHVTPPIKPVEPVPVASMSGGVR